MIQLKGPSMSLVGSLASLTQLTLPPRLLIQFSDNLRRLRLLHKLTSTKEPLTDSVLSMMPLKRLPMLLKPNKTPPRKLKQLPMQLFRLQMTQKKRESQRNSPISKLPTLSLNRPPLRLLSTRQWLPLTLHRPQTQLPPKS